MPDIEIKRTYKVLPDNNVRFGIKVINNCEFLIVDVDVILDYNKSLFKLDGNTIKNLGIIKPNVPRSTKFILTPLDCIHGEEIAATVRYKDHMGKRHTLEMRPKEVHCVRPFLKEKPISRGEFVELSSSGHMAEAGLIFQGVDAALITSLLLQTCKNQHYKVDEHAVESGTILYLASESIDEKAHYLLTVYIKETDGLTQLMLRAMSDKLHGLSGFLNEMVGSIRHIVSTVQSAREIGVIKKEQVINIIDSVVQRTTFGGEGATSVNIKGSVVQRTDFKTDEERKKLEEERLLREEEERLQKEKEEQERQAREEAERKQREETERREAAKREQKAREEREKQARLESERREQERLRKQKEIQERITPSVKEKKPLTKYLALVLVLGILAAGYGFMNSGSIDASEDIQFTTPVEVSAISQTPIATPTATQTPEVTLTTVATSAANSKTTTNSIGMEFLLIPAGKFEMGSPAGEKFRDDDEGPVHTVTIEKAYYMGKYEVTQKQWREVMSSNPSNFKGDDLPVEQVSWNDVQEFIKKLNEKERTNKYRLPSEAEWEYAARAGTTTRYSFGDDESDIGDYAFFVTMVGMTREFLKINETHPVGQKLPNPWGLYDMHGNVQEWVQDWGHSDYVGAPTDGRAWESGGYGSNSRVIRGDGTVVSQLRSASRVSKIIDHRYKFVGFRLLQEV